MLWRFARQRGYLLRDRSTEADTLAPEPSTMLLLGGALIGLSVVVRKRRS